MARAHLRQLLGRGGTWSLPCIAIGLLAAVWWALGLPGVDTQPGWFYRTSVSTPIGPVSLALTLLLAPVVCRHAQAAAAEGRRAYALSLLMLLGIAAQFTLHFLSPDGLEQSFSRLYGGHGKFLRVAAAQRGQLLHTLRDYEQLYDADALGWYAGTKAPGTLGFYMLLDAVAQWQPVQAWLAPLLELTRASRWTRMVPESAALIMVVFPCLTYLTLAPLVSLAESLLEDTLVGFDAALLCVSAPALLLIDLHCDGALYPLLGVSCIACVAAGARRRRPALSFVGGLLAGLGLYCSLGLLPCTVVALLAGLAIAVQTGVHLLPAGPRRGLRRLQLHDSAAMWTLAWFLGGLLLSVLLFVTLLNFQPVYRFGYSLALHAAWKRAVPTMLWRGLSLVEFGLYAGIPLMCAFAAGLLVSLRQLWRRRPSMRACYCALVGGLLLGLALVQGTNEVARIWLFMVPLIALAVASLLRARPGDDGRGARVLATTQAALTLVMKVRQPW